MQKKELTSQQIIDVAFGLFAKHGIDRTSLAMIAKEIGISKPAIYYHFDSKEALIQAIFEIVFRDYKFENDFDLEAFTKDNFASLLFESGMKTLPDDAPEHQVMYRVLMEFVVLSGRDATYAERLKTMQLDYIKGFQSLITKGIALGVCKPEHTEASAQSLALLLDNLSSYRFMGIAVDAELVWRLAVNHVLLREDV
ncbi:TetR/AcrR family transcriptional regulator [Aureibacillus halotolerans]|uniref:TetR family transcriptional regulator n=1 Tax=Aureibacillus halotolerans TaxID=1508390 RepID=A0A4R6UHM1_9BACI|nr:TetR/AcrR family transcriptional regulator [Aureibacillus halotolerans]TDQ42644.1 TetR family transcriptional regulator [Aureibacillus halotolerans]